MNDAQTPALLSALNAALTPLGAEPRRMFAGTCFMLNDNLLIGTHRDGLIVRVGPEAEGRALSLGARGMEMGGRPMKGWVLVDQVTELGPWLDLALAFNRQLPPGAAKARRRKR